MAIEQQETGTGIEQPVVTMTARATDKLKEVIAKQGRADLALRVYVTPGGCSGFSYGMTFAEGREQDDTLVETDGVRIVVASRKMQAADQALFRHLGIEPADVPILVLKSSVHFRADFQPIAAEILVAAAPGAMIADPADLPFERLRPGVRLRPNGPVSLGPVS